MRDEELGSGANLSDRQIRPLAGGYYWFPSPGNDSITWNVLTCHDLGCDADVGHADLWLKVIARLAHVWNKDARSLRRLKTHCYGLPRGRVTRRGRISMINHGNDAPLRHWLGRVIRHFDLDRRSVKPLFDEHERMFAEDRRQVMDALGITLGVGKEERCDQ
jgi:hypothetical protein